MNISNFTVWVEVADGYGPAAMSVLEVIFSIPKPRGHSPYREGHVTGLQGKIPMEMMG